MHETTSAPNSTQSDQPASPLVPDLAQRLTGKTVWVQRTVSPWIRRWLPSESTAADGGLQRPMALTAVRTTSFLGHIQRAVQTASLWRLDTDTIQPLRYDRFGRAIVARFPDTSQRFQTQPAAANPTDLILAGTGEIEIEPQPAAQQPEGFKPFASLADFKAALAAKERGENFEVEPQPPSQPSGPYNKPFASLADFKAALAAKERGENFEVEPQPPSQPSGPYNKPFASLADFQAALAAKEQETSAAAPAQPSAPANPAPIQTEPLPQSRSTPPQIQRLRQPGHPARTWPPGTRPRARIEEVTPAAETGPTGGQVPSTHQSEEEFGFTSPAAGQPERDPASNQTAEPPASVQRQPAAEVPPQFSSGPVESAESAQGLTQVGQPPAARQAVEPPPTLAVKTNPQTSRQRQIAPGRSEDSAGIKGQAETTAQRSSEFEVLPVEMATLPQPQSKSSPVESPAESESGREAPVQRATAETGQAALPAEGPPQQAGEASASGRAEAVAVVQSVEPKMSAAETQVAAEETPPESQETGVRPAQASLLLQRQSQTNLSNQTAAGEERLPEQNTAGRPAETASQTLPMHRPPAQSSEMAAPSETSAIQRSVEGESPRQLDAPGSPESLLPAASDEAELADVSSDAPEFILRREGTPSSFEPTQADALTEPAALPQPEAPVQRSIERQIEPATGSQPQPQPPVKQEPLLPDLSRTKSLPEDRRSSSDAAPPKEASGGESRPAGFQSDSHQAAVSQTSPSEEPFLSSGSELGLTVQRAGSPSSGAVSSLPLPQDAEELTLPELPVDRPKPPTLMESVQALPEEASTGSLEAPVQRSAEAVERQALVSPTGPGDAVPFVTEQPIVTTAHPPGQEPLRQGEGPVSLPARPEQSVPPVQRASELEMPLREPSPTPAVDESPPVAAETLPPERKVSEAPPVSIPVRPVQRASEVEMPLRESAPVGMTPTPVVDEPPSMAAETLPPERKVSEAPPVSIPVRPVQRASELEMPLREPSSTPAVDESPPVAVETLPPESKGVEAPPVSIPVKPVQRASELEPLLREPSPLTSTLTPVVDEPPSMAAETLPPERKGAEVPPVSIPARPVQRASELEPLLREPSPTPAVDEPPPVSAETLSPEREVSEEPPVSIPARPVQRASELELPLREPSPSTPTSTPAVDEPPSMASETLSPEGEGSEAPPVSIPARPEQSVPPVELELPLWEPRRVEPQPLDTGQGQPKPVPILEETEQAVPLSAGPPETTVLSGESSGPLVSQKGMVEPLPGLTGQATGTTIQQSPEEAVKMPLRWPPPLQRQPDDVSAVKESAQGGRLGDDILGHKPGLPLVAAGPMSQNLLDVTRKQPPMPALPQARGWTVQTEAEEIFEPTPFVTRPTRRDPHSAEGVAMPLTAPIRIETRRESIAAPLDMPLPVTPPAPTPVVQRQPVEVEPALPGTETAPAERVIQRAEDDGTTESDTMAGAELDKLAREIYPLIKRMMAVERERRPIR